MNQAISQNVTTPNATVPHLLTKAELADALRMSVRSVEGLLKSDKLPAGVRRGRLLYWHSSVVEKWLDEAFAAQRSWIPL
ncbi:hypothetical protein GCM10028796_25140 [Ramlibacter monticola]|uniref:Helix-turn-helix domain-containing protein n=1 Tax=Ramlibacter monticola TaxID=1926872 RepID=A0A936Z165_9BURK|nr:helix-turn-helix domain-containing protein [Ramlibacter monticola]MBL0392758.1 helix-turn-helix domain-containing protein [Ramlibacter monticola]